MTDEQYIRATNLREEIEAFKRYLSEAERLNHELEQPAAVAEIRVGDRFVIHIQEDDGLCLWARNHADRMREALKNLETQYAAL